MKNQKTYFSDIEEDFANTKDHLIEEMKERELTEIKISEVQRDLQSDYFFCKAVGEISEKPPYGEPCGKECELYKPRNGKSGCCRHRGFCYIPGKEGKLTIDGKIKY